MYVSTNMWNRALSRHNQRKMVQLPSPCSLQHVSACDSCKGCSGSSEMFTKPPLFKNPNVLHIGYMQQKEEKYEFNFCFLESCIMVSLLKKNKHMKSAVLFYMLEAKI